MAILLYILSSMAYIWSNVMYVFHTLVHLESPIWFCLVLFTYKFLQETCSNRHRLLGICKKENNNEIKNKKSVMVISAISLQAWFDISLINSPQLCWLYNLIKIQINIMSITECKIPKQGDFESRFYRRKNNNEYWSYWPINQINQIESVRIEWNKIESYWIELN